MGPNPQFSADLVIFTEKFFNGKLHFLCSVSFIGKKKIYDQALKTVTHRSFGDQSTIYTQEWELGVTYRFVTRTLAKPSILDVCGSSGYNIDLTIS